VYDASVRLECVNSSLKQKHRICPVLLCIIPHLREVTADWSRLYNNKIRARIQCWARLLMFEQQTAARIRAESSLYDHYDPTKRTPPMHTTNALPLLHCKRCRFPENKLFANGAPSQAYNTHARLHTPEQSSISTATNLP
jgi:hypothetical protein